jgi:hypothetical protein
MWRLTQYVLFFALIHLVLIPFPEGTHDDLVLFFVLITAKL